MNIAFNEFFLVIIVAVWLFTGQRIYHIVSNFLLAYPLFISSSSEEIPERNRKTK